MVEETPKRIVDNPTTQELKNVLPLLKMVASLSGAPAAFGIKSHKIGDLGRIASDALSQADVLDLPDQFNTAFSERGWVATSSMSIDVVRGALAFNDAGEPEKAEQAIQEWFSEENIRLFAITRAKRIDKTASRWLQLNEALSLTFEERYTSAVPLILIVCDGFASDVLGTSPFEKEADLSVFDSIVGHPTSLPSLIKLLTRGVRKSSDEDLTLPLRHGILHGRSLGYANKLVCMKSWMLMIALVDWATDKEDEASRKEERRKKENFSLRDFAERSRKRQADKEALEAFVPREMSPPFLEELDPNSPEGIISAFLSAWQNRNFGTMAKLAVRSAAEPINKVAGDMRRDVDQVALTSFDFHSFTQSSVAAASAVVSMQGRTLSGEVGGKFRIRAWRYTAEGDFAMPTDDGHWVVAQGCIFDLMYERTIKAQENES
jgi:hypothetical protein